MVNYTIEGEYTEKLNLSQFFDSFNKNEVNIFVNCRFKLQDSYKGEKYKLLKVFYDLNSDAPLYLNWIGVVVLKFNEAPKEELKPELFLDDDEILTFIEDSISNFSKYLRGSVPSFKTFLENIG